MLASGRVRLHAAVAAIVVGAMCAALVSPAGATEAQPATFGELSAAAGPTCQDGDVAVMQAGFSEPNASLFVTCGFTLDLNGQSLALNLVAVGRSLTIKDNAGGGSLTVISNGGVAIRVVAGTTLTIESGIVTATGKSLGAGIGGFSGGSGGVNAGTVNISGGTVTATGGAEAAGIGGGTDSNGGTVNISGGTVTATGGTNGAGIGSGRRGVSTAALTSGTVNISGGTVAATGGTNGAGIGGGAGGLGATVVITGGLTTDVTASGETAIGSGTTTPQIFGSLSVGGLLRLPSGVLKIPDGPGDEITVASNGRIKSTAAVAPAGAQFIGPGSIVNHGSITLAASLVTGGTPAATVKDNHHMVSFDTQGGSAAPSDVTVFARSFEAGARDFPSDPTRAGYAFAEWNTVADGSGDAVTSTSLLPGGGTGTPVQVTAFAQWIDNSAPVTAIDSGPGSTADGTADFAFSANEPSTFECRLDGPGVATGTATTCTSPQSYSGLADGGYTFSVTATDTSGNADASAETRTFTVTTPSPPPPVLCGGVPATIVGTSGSEVIDGTAGDDVIAANGGDDVVRGLGGADIICGGDGNDRLKGGAGKDRLYGEAGRDKLTGGGSKDSCFGGAGKDTVGCEKAKQN